MLQSVKPIKNQELPESAPIVPDLSHVEELRGHDQAEALEFLRKRPIHTVVMTSYINDNGITSELNRGIFYAFRNSNGAIEGIALIGHTTLVEARSEAAIAALAYKARSAETPIYLIMSAGEDADRFWAHMSGHSKPRLRCTELLFETSFPFPVQPSDWELKNAEMSHLMSVAKAQAEVAYIESGVDPLVRDRDGFIERVARRIEQNRVFVVLDGEKLVFKADVIAKTSDVIYLEGVYVAPEYRGRGVGSSCLGALALDLMSRADRICLLSNIEFAKAHRSFIKAGFHRADHCTTLFV